MSIHEFLMDRYDPAHLVDQKIHDMEVIVDASAEGGNGMDHIFVAALSVNGAATLLVLVFMCFLLGWGVTAMQLKTTTTSAKSKNVLNGFRA